MPKKHMPRIVIVMGGGLMQEVLSNGAPAEIAVVDYDADDVDPDQLVQCPLTDGEGTEEAYLTLACVEKRPDKVAQIFAALQGSNRFDVQIFCDGSAHPDSGEAGCGIALYQHGELSEFWFGEYHEPGTSDSAEFIALHQALTLAEKHATAGRTVQVLCDSKYVIEAMQLAERWAERGWRKRNGAPIKNAQLIQTTHALYNRIKSQIELTHVPSHAGTAGNELADRMAALAISTRQHAFRRIDAKAA